MIFVKKITDPFDFYSYLAGHTDYQYVILSKSVAIITLSFPYKFSAVLRYGTSPANLTNSVVDNNLTRHKRFILTGLNVDTEYYYRIEIRDYKGNFYYTPIQSFKTGQNVDMSINFSSGSLSFVIYVSISSLGLTLTNFSDLMIEFDYSNEVSLDTFNNFVSTEIIDFANIIYNSSSNLKDIYSSNVSFNGIGLNDLRVFGSTSTNESGVLTAEFYKVQIDGIGNPDRFRWSRDGGATWEATNVAITGNWQRLIAGSGNSIYIRFLNTTGHTLLDEWTFYAYSSFGIVYHYTIT